MKKRIFLLICLIFLLVSCGNGETGNQLAVRSTYPKLDVLTEGEFSFENQTAPTYAVSSLEGTLLITDRKYYDQDELPGVIHTTRVGSYWGDETGLFHQDENGDNEIVTTEALVGWIPFLERDVLFVVTGGVNKGSLHLLHETYEKDHSRLVFEGMPMAISYVSGTDYFYIATDKEFFKIDLSEFFKGSPHMLSLKKENLTLPDDWAQLEIGSMCIIENTIYMGTQAGVLAYDTVTGEYTKYPIDFKQALGK